MAEEIKAKEQPEVNPKTEGLKLKKKKPGRPRKLIKEVETVKLDLTKKKEDAVKQARETRDQHLRDMLQWHFDPATGCPFWLEWLDSVDWDVQVSAVDASAHLGRER